MTPTLDGQLCFGVAVHMKVMLNPSAVQIVEFFGVDGLFAMYGGRRSLAWQHSSESST
jgi:hypothetical protein